MSRWEQFLKETIQDEKEIQALQEFFGYCLISRNPYNKFLILAGPVGSGKGTIVNVLISLLGADNVSFVESHHIGRVFHNSVLDNKLLNVSEGLDLRSFNVPRFLSLLAGDPVEAGRKYEAHFILRYTGKFLFVLNEAPPVLGGFEGHPGRIILVTTKRAHIESEMVVELLQDLSERMVDLQEWAKEGLRRLTERYGY